MLPVPFHGRDDRARLRAERRRRARELERSERRMAAWERALEEQLEDFDGDFRRALQEIDADLRVQHWGREPERPPSWRRS